MGNHKNICPNCNNTLPIEAKYCPACSQKVRSGKITVREFLQEFIDNVFNLDSKLFQTLGGLFIPGKLTTQFFAGKRKSYAPPIRLFLIMLVGFLTCFSFVVNDEDDLRHADDTIKYGQEKIVEKKMMSWMDSIRNKISHEFPNDSAHIFLIDTFLVEFKETAPERRKTFAYPFYDKEKGWFKIISFKAEDVVALSHKKFIEKYDLEGFPNSIIAKRMMKFTKNPNDLNRFYLGSFTWMALLLLPFMGLVLMLFYSRKKYYFIEHLIFLYHIHAFFFLTGIILFGLQDWLTVWMHNLIGIITGIYILMAFKNVYQESWGKTIFKIFLFLNLYLIALAIFMILFLLISFFFF